MLGLLGFPNFADPSVPGLALPSFARLREKVFESLALCVRGNFDRSLFRNERDLIVSVLVGRAVEDRTDARAQRHVISSPRRFKQNAILILHRAIGPADQNQFAVAARDLVDLACDRYAAQEYERLLLAHFNAQTVQVVISQFLGRLECVFFPIANRRTEPFFVIVDAVTRHFFVRVSERGGAGCSQIDWRFSLCDDFRERSAYLQTG